MNSRRAKSLVAQGKLVLTERILEEINASTPFQKVRLRQAVTAAQLYLSGTGIKEIALTLQSTYERARQIISLGIRYMLREELLKPQASPSPGSSPSPKAPAPSPSKSAESDRALS